MLPLFLLAIECPGVCNVSHLHITQQCCLRILLCRRERDDSQNRRYRLRRDERAQRVQVVGWQDITHARVS